MSVSDMILVATIVLAIIVIIVFVLKPVYELIIESREEAKPKFSLGDIVLFKDETCKDTRFGVIAQILKTESDDYHMGENYREIDYKYGIKVWANTGSRINMHRELQILYEAELIKIGRI